MKNESMLTTETAVAPGAILIVDEETAIRHGSRAVLARDGHQVSAAGNVAQALVQLHKDPFEAAIVDIRMPGRSGTDLLREIRERHPQTAVILLTGHGTLQTVMAAIHAGAAAYLLKPDQPAAP